MATKFTIVKGETEETVAVKPKHILRMERESKSTDYDDVEQTYRLAWWAVGGTGDDAAFEAWMDEVDDIIPILPEEPKKEGDGAEELPDVPPTTGGSRPSRSKRG